MTGKEGLAAERVRTLMLKLVERLEAEVERFQREPPPEPAQRIKFITDAARAGRAIVLAEAAAVRAEQLVEGVGQRNPAGGAEDKDEGMRDCDFTEDQLVELRDRVEQRLAEYAGPLETKGAAGGGRRRQAQPDRHAGDARPAPEAPPG